MRHLTRWGAICALAVLTVLAGSSPAHAQAAEEDRFEENDRREDARTIEAGFYPNLHLADDDWFRVEGVEETLTVTLRFVHDEGDVDLELHDDAGNLLERSNGTSDEESVTVDASGTVLVRVYGFGDSVNDYDMLVRASDDDPFEPNDTMEEASSLTQLGTYFGLRLADDDWYAIDHEGDLTVRVGFDHDRGDVDVEVLDAEGRTLDTSTGTTDVEELEVTCRGRTYIRVYGFGDATNDYDMELLSTEDPFEENDTIETAASLEPGRYGNLTCDDDDWYRVDGEGLVTVDLEFHHADGDIDLELVDPGGAVVASSTSTTDGESASWESEGELYVRVFAFGEAGNPYVLEVTQEGVVESDDPFEPNQTREEAAPIEPGSHAGLTCDGDDWYRVEGDGELTVEVTFEHDDGDIDLELVDASGSLGTSQGLSDSESLTAEVSGPVFIHVYVYGDGENTYDMNVSTGGADPFEPNQTRETATSLDPGSHAGLTCDGDDWYRVEGDGELTVELSFVDDDGDIDVEITDPRGNELDSSSGMSDSETVSAEISGPALVHVYVFGGGENTYDMNVSLEGSAGGGADSFEPNDERGRAASIDPGTHRDLFCNEDDWYMVRGEGELTVELSFVDDDGDIDVEITDPRGNELNSSSGTSDSESVSAEISGTALIHVYVFAGGENSYDMTVSLGGSDRFEPNQSREDASAITTGRYTGLTCDEDDWYRIEGSGEMSVELSFEHAGGDIDVAIQDGSGNRLDSAASTTDGERVEARIDGTAYIHVYVFGSGQNSYDMAISLGTTDDQYEENDSVAEAVPLFGEHEDLVLADDDYFRLPEGEMTVTIRFSHDEGDLDLEIVDADGNSLERSAGTSDEETITVNVSSDERRYVHVYRYGDGGDAQTYDISIR